MALTPEYFMGLAFKKTRHGIDQGQAPFGCCIVKDDSILSCEHNLVWSRKDITAHAEIIAIREACRKIKAVNLSGCTLYSTCEPCPMCFSAAHWAKVSKIVFGSRIGDAQNLGFSELELSNEKFKELLGLEVEIQGDFLREEAVELFTEYEKQFGSKVY